MAFLCGFPPRRRFLSRKRDDPDFPKRSRTISIFGSSNKNARQALRSLVGVSTLIPPDKSAPLSPNDPIEIKTPIGNRFHDIVDELYDGLKGDEDLLSREKLYVFLKDVQCEPIIKNLDKEQYTAGEFRRVLVEGYDVNAIGPPPEKDLSRPLTNYFISSSHNTYLDGNQLSSTSTPEAYRNVLSRDCRCIEIDVWNGNPSPSRERSKSPVGGHSRGPSRTTLTNVAPVTAPGNVDQKVKVAVNHLLGEKSSLHSRSPSAHSRTVVEDLSPRTSLLNLSDTKESNDRLEVFQAHSPRSPRQLQPHQSPRQPRQHSPPRGEPIVTHGHTLTVPCGFREVCKAIKESAFENNDLPVIISLEVHADHEQQEVMVRIMKEEWQGFLVTEAHEDFDPRFRLPKLQDLKRKILVKVKKATVTMEPVSSQNPLDSAAQVVSQTTSLTASQVTGNNMTKCSSQSTWENAPDRLVAGPGDSDTISSENNASHNYFSETPAKRASATAVPVASPDKVNTGRICQSLGDLAVYTRSEHFRTFEAKEAKRPAHVFSISEKRILELYQRHRRDVFSHNKNYFMRAYPDKMRWDSSNPDPSLFWRRGVQMVAMNWQKTDTGMMINEGMFAGENGWVLKPPGYQSSDKSSESHDEATPGRTLNLRLTIFAGQNIPTQSDDSGDEPRSGSAIRPYVKVTLHVEKSELATGKEINESNYKKRTGAGATNNPKFPESRRQLEFAGITNVVPELSFVRFRIGDDTRLSTSILAWACIRLDRLRPGYRYIPLMDMEGTPIPHGALYVKIEKSTV
ncbi:1-phosphatidylinositol-4,5-bisphosphate phosphodiesterase 1 [Metarhizium album ARSEF 1941]|uniref:Phosphoinositide phospholipase C n=1 Tax=Metarhizium album (strain ARSEF 1941) TaxID=1081103 RepID=A0A0B2WLD4_METAS|nr:1-phosphatidylinositol-4,5-bisphosphate phosphodiesterase 1 [Metarhizium album ARSEF 1941]KHN94272.1 1-phosphatidylinositol-4,5-bisphosphate phosphodiesterase 1 [Metarhizium album ARSEF 1941]